MAKRIKENRGSSEETPRLGARVIVLTGIMLGIIVITSVAISQRPARVSRQKEGPVDGHAVSAASLSPDSPSKEYIYAGGRLVATEERGGATGQPRPDTIGITNPAGVSFSLRNSNTSGPADISFNFGPAGGISVMGDWNNDGTDTPGVFKDGTWYLRNSNTPGAADIIFQFGGTGDQPIAGDWDGDGDDTVGLFAAGGFFLRNSNSAGPADIVFAYGVAGNTPLAGDWNGDGTDTVGVYVPSGAAFFLRNTNTTGQADISVTYGLPNDLPLTGDWDGDGDDTIAVYKIEQGVGYFFLRNTNSVGYADLAFSFMTGVRPLSGVWQL